MSPSSVKVCPLLSKTASTLSVRKWLQKWFDNHLLDFEEIKHYISWDGKWVNGSSAEELQKDLLTWDCDVSIAKRIVKEMMAGRETQKKQNGYCGGVLLYMIMVVLLVVGVLLFVIMVNDYELEVMKLNEQLRKCRRLA